MGQGHEGTNLKKSGQGRENGRRPDGASIIASSFLQEGKLDQTQFVAQLLFYLLTIGYISNLKKT